MPEFDDLPVKPGDLLAGKYEVERVIGTGGMGVVLAAHHVSLRERVALKMLLPQYVKSPEVRARFLREAQASVRIKSEHVARIMDVGELEGGVPYIVMEYLEGQDLGFLLDANGPIGVSDAVSYVLQACEAIAEAHARGVVHRDIKPANLFLTHRSDGSSLVKVLDFGISKPLIDEGKAGVTTTGKTIGSPQYMSPEQVRNARTVDTRTDVWSLGVVLYELIANKAPFASESVTGVLAAIVSDQPVPLPSSVGAPPGLQEVIFRCLEKDKDRRIQSIGDLAQRLEAFAPPSASVNVQRIRGTERAPLPAPSMPSVSTTAPTMHLDRSNEASSTQLGATMSVPTGGRGRGMAMGVAALVVVATLGAGAVLWTRRAVPPVAAAEPPPAAPSASSPVATAEAPAPILAVAPTTSAAPSISASAVAAKPHAAPRASTVRPSTTKPGLGTSYDSRK